MVGHISDYISSMAEKERLQLNKNNSLMELKQLVRRHTTLSDHSDTTESFSDTTVEKNKHDTTEESSGPDNVTTESNIPALPKSTAIAITHLVKKLVEEFTKQPTVTRQENSFKLNANGLKKIVHDMENNIAIETTDKKTKKEALSVVRLNTIVDKIKNQMDKVLINKYEKIIKATRQNKYKFKIYELPYDNKNPLIDDILNALNHYKGFEYIAYKNAGPANRCYTIYFKLDYVWE